MCSRRVGKARLLDMEQHRVEWGKCPQPDREIEEILDGLASVVELGRGDQLLD